MKKFEKYKVCEALNVPDLYDTVGKVIRFGYTEVTRVNDEGKKEKVFRGYNIPLSGLIDYGHIKSQIVEHVYPQKEEFALLNNAVAALLKERTSIKDDSIEKDIQAFMDFEEWRAMAAAAAKELISKFK
jgi:hypothetical protein